MSDPLPPPAYADLLRAWLPAVWRERDDSGDLQQLLGACGALLDDLRATIAQRRVDAFPDAQPDGRHCQPWLLPYIAQLLDVRLVSPDEAGRRAELASSVAWRQRKGTRVTVEQIAEAVGQFEVEVQEGFQRVALTPRVDRALLPESAYGEPAIAAGASFDQRAAHPGLPAATLDLRRCSRAVRSSPDHLAAHTTRFQGQPIAWRQVHRHGVPCAPGSYQDVSRRTVDLRSPQGRIHPRRVLLHLPPPEGHCSSQARSVAWSQLTGAAPVGSEWVRHEVGSTLWKGASVPLHTWTGLDSAPVRMTGTLALDTPAVHRFVGLWLDEPLQLSDGALELDGCAARSLRVDGEAGEQPVLQARASLIDALQVAQGAVRLEYVTVLSSLVAHALQASDCLLLPPLRGAPAGTDVPADGCLRHSRLWYQPIPPVPGDPTQPNDPLWRHQGLRPPLCVVKASCTTVEPIFWSTVFGQPGCGVLHPQADPALQGGAEDGGEMGACHEWRHVLRRRAVLDKLAEYLPVGIEPVLIFDPTLACAPPLAL